VALDILPDISGFKPRERTGEIKPTDGTGIDHIAFSFINLDAALAPVKAAGIPIEQPIVVDVVYGTRSFFLRSPEGVLVGIDRGQADSGIRLALIGVRLGCGAFCSGGAHKRFKRAFTMMLGQSPFADEPR
jgi:hypothetical protein